MVRLFLQQHRFIKRVASFALWLAVWQLATLLVGSHLLLASPVETAQRLLKLVVEPSTWSAIAFSGLRIFWGFSCAFIAGLLLGLLSARSRILKDVLAPAVSFLKSVPLVCVIVLLLLWVGSARVSAIAVFLAVFPAIFFSAQEGLSSADGRLGDALALMGVSAPRRFLADTWQQLLSYVIATCKNACGIAWKSGVAAELIGSPRGSMGEAIYQSKLLLETADLFAWTCMIVFCSWLAERVFLWLLEQTGPLALCLACMGLTKKISHTSACAPDVQSSASQAQTTASTRHISMPDAQSLFLDHVSLGYSAQLEGDSTRNTALKHQTQQEDSEVLVASDITLQFAAHSRTVIGDVSGSGKSTLIAVLLGLLPPRAGRVGLAQEPSVMFQDTRLVEGLSAVDNILLSSQNTLSRADVKALACELLPADSIARPVRELSGGQRRRVEVLRALAHPSTCVILDEPFAALDEVSHKKTASLINSWLKGRTLIVASHSTEDAKLLDAHYLCVFQHSAER